MLTDLPECVTLLEKNIALNADAISPPASVEVRSLTWGERAHDVAFDLVLVSDCIYYEAALEPLVSTLADLFDLNVNTRVLVSYEDRSSSSAEKQKVQERFLDLAEAAGFSLRHYSAAECHPDYSSEDIHVLNLQKKPLQ